jgi:hypothetical protein
MLDVFEDHVHRQVDDNGPHFAVVLGVLPALQRFHGWQIQDDLGADVLPRGESVRPRQ